MVFRPLSLSDSPDSYIADRFLEAPSVSFPSNVSFCLNILLYILSFGYWSYSLQVWPIFILFSMSISILFPFAVSWSPPLSNLFDNISPYLVLPIHILLAGYFCGSSLLFYFEDFDLTSNLLLLSSIHYWCDPVILWSADVHFYLTLPASIFLSDSWRPPLPVWNE